MPMGIGEPHYAQMIKMDKLKPWDVYPQVGWDPLTQAPSEFATAARAKNASSATATRSRSS